MSTIPSTGQDTGQDARQDTGRTTASTSTRSRTRRVLRVFVALFAAVLVGGGMTFGMQSPANAALVTQYQNFSAECRPTSIEALAPDMTFYPNNAVSWFPTLKVYTDTGWKKVMDGPAQDAIGDNLQYDPWGGLTGSWMQSTYAFGPLVRGHYYAITLTYQWAGPNVDHYIHRDVLAPHHIAQGNFNMASIQYSSAGYCYIP